MTNDDDTKRAKALLSETLGHTRDLVALGMSKSFFMEAVSDYWDKCDEIIRLAEFCAGTKQTRHLRVVK